MAKARAMAWVVLSLLRRAACPARRPDGARGADRFADAVQTSQTPAAQTPAGSLRVFVTVRLRRVYLKQNVGFIDYVRDRAVADLHCGRTTELTGGGGEA